MKRIFPTLVFICFAFPSVAEVYKWRDKDGKVHFSDSPPESVKSEKLEINTNKVEPQTSSDSKNGKGKSELSSLKDKCDKLILPQQSKQPIALYSIAGKWSYEMTSDCLNGPVRKDKGFSYSWEFRLDGIVKLGLKSLNTAVTFRLEDNIIYLDNLAKTTMILMYKKGTRIVWAHIVGGKFYAYYHVARNFEQ